MARSCDDYLRNTGKNGNMAGGTKASCRDLIAMLKREPNRFFAQLERRVAHAIDKRWVVQVAAGFNRDQAPDVCTQSLSTVIALQDDPNFPRQLFRARGISMSCSATYGSPPTLVARQ